MIISQLIYSVLAVALLIPSHDLFLGTFALTLKEHEARLECKLDKHNLEDAAMAYYGLETATEEALRDYLTEKLRISFNGAPYPLQIDSVHSDDAYSHFFSSIPIDQSPLTSIRIYNACLVDELPNQTNIFYLIQDDEQRGFSMHKDRFVIEIDL